MNEPFDTKGRRRRDGCGNAQARYGNPQLRNLGLKKVKQHVPCGIGEQILGEIAGAQTRARMTLPTVSTGLGSG